MYAFDAGLHNVEGIEVPRRADFSLDLETVRRAVNEYQPKMLFLVMPNNPDGSARAGAHGRLFRSHG